MLAIRELTGTFAGRRFLAALDTISLLEEVTIPIAPGDLFVLYTDGITDTADASGDWVGERRLATLAEKHADLPLDDLRERIPREIRFFMGSAPQHDDMTIVLFKVE